MTELTENCFMLLPLLLSYEWFILDCGSPQFHIKESHPVLHTNGNYRLKVVKFIGQQDICQGLRVWNCKGKYNFYLYVCWTIARTCNK